MTKLETLKKQMAKMQKEISALESKKKKPKVDLNKRAKEAVEWFEANGHPQIGGISDGTHTRKNGSKIPVKLATFKVQGVPVQYCISKFRTWRA